MKDSNFSSNSVIFNVSVKTISLVFSKAASIIEHRSRRGGLDADGARLVGDLWFSFKLISDLQCLDGYIGLVGLDRFCSLLAAMSCLESGENDKILCAYLEHEFHRYSSMYSEQLNMEIRETMH